MILNIEREAIQRAQHVIAVSKVTKKHLTDQCGASAVKVSVAYNSYTLNQSRLLRKGSFTAGTVVFVGRLEWQKGSDTFVKLAESIHKLRPGTQFKIYGDGPAREKISAAIQKAFPRQKTPYSPWVEEDVKHKWHYSDFSTLVQPVDLDNSGSIRVRYDPITDEKEMLALNGHFATLGFDYTPVQGYESYTHLISVSKPPKGYGADYLIQTNRLLPFDLTKPPVRLAGGLRWQDRLQAFSQATVVVVPSRSEPFGLVVLEAMECGVPVLYPKHAGVASVIRYRFGATDDDLGKWTNKALALLNEESSWRKTVEMQQQDLQAISGRRYDAAVTRIWDQLI